MKAELFTLIGGYKHEGVGGRDYLLTGIYIYMENYVHGHAGLL